MAEPDKILSVQKLDKISELSFAMENERENTGYSITLSDSRTFIGRGRSKLNDYTLVRDNYVTGDLIVSNEGIQVSKIEDIDLIVRTMSSFGKACHFKLQQLIGQVNACSTNAEVKAITWTTPTFSIPPSKLCSTGGSGAGIYQVSRYSSYAHAMYMGVGAGMTDGSMNAPRGFMPFRIPTESTSQHIYGHYITTNSNSCSVEIELRWSSTMPTNGLAANGGNVATTKATITTNVSAAGGNEFTFTTNETIPAGSYVWLCVKDVQYSSAGTTISATIKM